MIILMESSVCVCDSLSEPDGHKGHPQEEHTQQHYAHDDGNWAPDTYMYAYKY